MSAGDLLQRLWAPHRMAYVTGEDPSSPEQDDSCPFCRIPDGNDADSLVLTRGELAYAVLNLHPYNPGHLMVLPFRHVAAYEDLTSAEAADIALLTQQALRTVRAVSAPHGFNVGLNLGGVAGGSVADHLHQHVVPRWSGDANFITVVGETKLLPQLLADTRNLLTESWER
ncbi:MAG: HIT domain-containing protein [Actinomycetota bacterium]|nr:HIT domain-containing protein [Actinomycetota bacterium]